MNVSRGLYEYHFVFMTIFRFNVEPAGRASPRIMVEDEPKSVSPSARPSSYGFPGPIEFLECKLFGTKLEKVFNNFTGRVKIRVEVG